MKKLICCCAGLAAATLSTQADTIAKWTFETSVPATAGPFSPEIGSGSALGNHVNSLVVYSTPAGNGSSHSFSSSFWSVNDYYQFSVSTLNYQNISLSFDQTSSSTGPRDFLLQYSLNGSDFSLVNSYTVLQNGLAPNASWNATTAGSAYSYSYDLSGVSALNGASTAFFRLMDNSTTSASGGTVGTGGTDRVDNFTVNGSSTIVPEPTTLSLIGGFGLLAYGFARRKH